MFLKVVQQTPALTYQAHQTAVGGKVFFISILEMAGDLGDTLCEQGDLAFNRTGVGF